jgi:hypothetical protein
MIDLIPTSSIMMYSCSFGLGILLLQQEYMDLDDCPGNYVVHIYAFLI